MDKTDLWNDSVQARSYASVNGPGPSIRTPAVSHQDTAVATLCADGSKLPLMYTKHLHKGHVITMYVFSLELHCITHIFYLDY